MRWDSGNVANYNIGGRSNKFELRIYDNATLGENPSFTCCHCYLMCSDTAGLLNENWIKRAHDLKKKTQKKISD